jgi:hypothetical protein
MSAGHTPGRLKVEGPRNSKQVTIRNADRCPPEAEWDNWYVDLSGFVGDINPHVFASAPDLLERLRQARDRLQDMLAGDDGQAWDEAEKALPLIDATIARATGAA